MNRHKGFTIVELLVVVSIIALLIAILLPAIGKARDAAKVNASKANLRQFGQAAGSYAADWADAQFTLTNHNISRYGTNRQQAFAQYATYNGEDHPPLLLGWAGGGLWGYWMNHLPNSILAVPMDFNDMFGFFRVPNAKQFGQYVSGRYYDPVYYAPKDHTVRAALEECIDDPGEFSTCFGNQNTIWSSYCFSPAALVSPDVMRIDEKGGFQNPWSLPAGFRPVGYAQVRYSDLKTHMLEHHWLQQARVDCNPAFSPGTYDGCEPYYFNMSYESVPMTLFYDGHVEGMGVREAFAADERNLAQAGYGLWLRSTPSGSDGYFLDVAYDSIAPTSFHIHTADGALGRDKIAD